MTKVKLGVKTLEQTEIVIVAALLRIGTLVCFGKANGFGAAMTTLSSDKATLTRTTVTNGDTLDTDETITSCVLHLMSGNRSIAGLGYLAQKVNDQRRKGHLLKHAACWRLG